MKPVLSIEEVANLLHCAVDTVRRIPLSELPCARVGRRNLYLLDDLVAFVRARRIGGAKVIPLGRRSLPSPTIPQLIESLADDVRRRSF